MKVDQTTGIKIFINKSIKIYIIKYIHSKNSGAVNLI